MRVVLADLRDRDGRVSKDTVAGGYGSRFPTSSRVTRIIGWVKRLYGRLPSIQMAYLAAIFAAGGHEVVWTPAEPVDGDVAIVLSSLVDYRRETAWARLQRARGARTGFVGLAASKLPELFLDHGDFVIAGEPEAAAIRIARGDRPEGLVPSEPLADLDRLPFPAWDLIDAMPSRRVLPRVNDRAPGRLFPVLASRGCPEFCTYCPHRILAPYRCRSVGSVLEELAQLCTRWQRPYVVFRDPLFTEQRDRCLALADGILARGLDLRFECETRLDRLDEALLDRLHRAGLRAVTFGVESVRPETLRKVGRRPIPPAHQRRIVAYCRSRGITTAAFYVFGFLEDDRDSIAATIDYSLALGSTFAQYKLLTPYPGTPLWRQLAPLVYERDWERFDGFTPTFRHPALGPDELSDLLRTAYTRFYVRPSFLANYVGLPEGRLRRLVGRLDEPVAAYQMRLQAAGGARC
ncbi:MAG TPA: radical SAM protein [Vicinamibacterales bacterium]|nr:radical SAM protein [Vicinamibacterales bacterium]